MTSLLACKVKGCPAPESEEWHRCWLIGHGECFGGISHQHTKKRSQGGKVIDACLCIGHHDKVDNGLWGNKIVDGTWVAYDEDHNILVRRNLNGSVSEPETLEGAGSAVARSSGSYSAPLDTLEQPSPYKDVPTFASGGTAPLKEEQDGVRQGLDRRASGGRKEDSHNADSGRAVRGIRSSLDSSSGAMRVDAGHDIQGARDSGLRAVQSLLKEDGRLADSAPSGTVAGELGARIGSIGDKSKPTDAMASPPAFVPEELTRAECIAWAQRLRAERERNPWMTGDLLNAAERIDDTDNSWEPSTGESLLDILRLQLETASNYQRVAAAYSATERVLGLSFGHHQSVYKLPDRDSWLKLAVDEGLSVSELRRRIKPPQPKPRRFTVGEILHALNDYCEPCEGCEIFRTFLLGLESIPSKEGNDA